MELMSWLLLGLLLVSCLYLWDKIRSSKTPPNFPPGPWALPLLGSPWLLFKDTHVLLTELSRKFGDVVSFNIFGDETVLLNSTEAIREAFASQATGLIFSGRQQPLTISPVYNHSTMFSEPTQDWSRKRKLIHKILNMYGEGVQETEGVIHEELSHVISWLESQKGAVNLDHVIYPSLSNILVMLLRGKRYDYDSKVLTNIHLYIDNGNLSFSGINNLLLSKFPFLRYLPIGPGRYIRLVTQSTEQFLKDVYEENKATYDPNETRGMIDYLLHQQEESRARDGESWLSDEEVKAIVLEMIDAGSSTTRGALYAFFLILVHKPEVAKRVQEEIDDVIGQNRRVKIEDRANMPYTQAAIFELLRYISHVPLGIPHETTEDVTFMGYFLPKRTVVSPNLWGCHHDERSWSDAWEYKPERFLDENKQLLPTDHPHRKNLLPFGIGRRFCVGETFARSRMFVFIVALLQRFNFSRDPVTTPPSCDPRTFRGSAVIWPDDYYVRVESRD